MSIEGGDEVNGPIWTERNQYQNEGYKRKIQISEERDRLKSEPFTGDCFGGGGGGGD